MKLPWAKTKGADKPVVSPSPDCATSALPESGSRSRSPVQSDQPASRDTIDSEKRAVEPGSTIHQEGDEIVTSADSSNPAATDQHLAEKKNGNDNDNLTRTVSVATESSDAGGPGEDDESKYATGLPLHLLTVGLTLSTFVIALDNTIIATAIPKITTVFNSLDDVGWYGSSYLLTTTSLQPSFGKVYTYFNVKWTYMLALVIFEVGSVLCGAAVNSTMLIVGRAVAGAGAAALFSGGMTIVAYSVPLRKRPIYIGLLSSMFGIASVVGPILGGAFTDRMLKTPLPSKVAASDQSTDHLPCVSTD